MPETNAAPDPTRRFSDRVEAYVGYRPGYPAAALDRLLDAAGLGPGAAVADVGAGSGIFTRLLVERGMRVYAVEPNAAMRAAAADALGGEPDFIAVAASAEATGLAPASVDLVTAAQAFHWFANDAALAEFGRILKPGGRLALIWNRRDLRQPFQREYNALLRKRLDDYTANSHMRFGEAELARFFAQRRMATFSFAHAQRLDLDGVLGRLRSASYCPPEDSAAYRDLERALARLVARHARAGSVEFAYDTRLYVGEVAR